jgi:hypothetical protein
VTRGAVERLLARHRSTLGATEHCESAATAQGAKLVCDRWFADPRTDVATGVTRSRNMRSRYRCSMCPAIHINSRSWLRSSSTHEPSDPPLRVIFGTFDNLDRATDRTECQGSVGLASLVSLLQRYVDDRRRWGRRPRKRRSGRSHGAWGATGMGSRLRGWSPSLACGARARPLRT